MSRKAAFQAMDISFNTFIIFAEMYYLLSKLMLCFYVLRNKAILYLVSCICAPCTRRDQGEASAMTTKIVRRHQQHQRHQMVTGDTKPGATEAHHLLQEIHRHETRHTTNYSYKYSQGQMIGLGSMKHTKMIVVSVSKPKVKPTIENSTPDISAKSTPVKSTPVNAPTDLYVQTK